MTYYRADADTYEAVRAAIDAAQGWPDAGTVTSIEPAATAPRDAAGRVLLAASDWLVVAAREQLAGLAEIDEGEYSPTPPSAEHSEPASPA
jgi:hypothetical protein